jgi:uncharacterized protein (TIGR04255 family)
VTDLRAPSFSLPENSKHRGKLIPEKLINDAIVEAIFEIRFSMATIPEVFFGRIADCAFWKDFKQETLPMSLLPADLRKVDLNLRYQPIFALIDDREKRAVRIGANVITYSRGMPYVGWKAFRTELEEVVAAVFEKTKELRVERLGLRYLNALRNDLHGIRSISDLDLKLEIAGETVTGGINVNVTADGESDTACTVRIATTDVIRGNLPPSTSVYVDVDVFTSNEGFATTDREFVKEWIEKAHSKEKVHFFRLLTESTIESLRER